MKSSFLCAALLAGVMACAMPGTAGAMQARAGGQRAPSRAAARPFVRHSRPFVRARPFGPRIGFGYGPDFRYGYPYYPTWYQYYSDVGGLRLEVKPKSAQVFVDGYYAGIVDNFDGYFQHLDLTPGGHRIEVRQPGFAPVTFEAYIQPGQTTDYKARMEPARS